MLNRNQALAAVAMSLAVSACGAASSQEPDSSNPAHCMVAFTYARELALGGKKPDLALAVQSTARTLFEGKKMKANGTFESGEKEGAAFAAAHGRDEKVMMPLVLECGKRQDADPAYQALNESGELMAAARKTDPACRNDPACAISAR